MKIEENWSLEKYNTFRLPVKTRWFMEYENEEELQKILHDEYFQECQSLHIGGGSNLLFLDDYNGIILHSQIKGIEITEEKDHVLLRIGAAEKWDDVVMLAVSKGWGGIENLSHIPGETGAAAIQNIGAYGVELKDVVVMVETFHQLSSEKRVFTNTECEYDYRNSYFKNEHNDPYIITHVTLRLEKEPVYRLNYGGLSAKLKDVPLSLIQVRTAIIALRNEKLPDPDVLGNCGSFFKNPIIPRELFQKIEKENPTISFFPLANDQVKISAGWLIEQCGFKGKQFGSVGVYDKQALVLVNLAEATGGDIALLAGNIYNVVFDRFGIELIPEVKYI